MSNVNGIAHRNRIEGLLRESLKSHGLEVGARDLDKISIDLEEGGVYKPLVKVSQKIYYLEKFNTSWVVRESTCREVRITRDGFKYMFESTYSGDILSVKEEGFGQLWFTDYYTAYNICKVVNNLSQYTPVKESLE